MPCERSEGERKVIMVIDRLVGLSLVLFRWNLVPC